MQNDSSVVFCAEEVELARTIHFKDLENIVLTGRFNKTNITCAGNSETGFQISGCQNLKILNLQFKYCGGANGSNEERTESASTLHVSNSMDISIRNVHITSGHGRGLIMLDSYGNVEDCLFQDNKEAPGRHDYGGGMYVALSHAPEQGNSSLSLTINNCHFLSNIVTLQKQKSKLATRIHCSAAAEFKYALRGGGIAIFVKGEVSGATITIKDVHIVQNQAIWGGGMYIHFCKHAYDNTVYIENTNISGNICKQYGGGGVDIGFTNENRANSIVFKKSNFEHNRAFFGGGTALYIGERNLPNATITFKNCSWNNNSAYYGAAMDMAPLLIQPTLHVHTPTIVLKNVHFENNKVETTTIRNDLRNTDPLGTEEFHENRLGIGKGTLLIAGLKLHFEGKVSFTNNTGSAIHAISSNLSLAENTDISFIRNTGFRGGAIALIGFSAILVSKHVTVNMTSNYAQVGGAIFHKSIDQHDYLFSRSCFIQKSSNETSQVAFSFTDNHAGAEENNPAQKNYENHLSYGDSIFTTTLLPCFEYCGLASPSNNFSCIGDFHYYNQTEPVVTSGAYFSHNISEPLHLVPGKETDIPFKLLDDLDQEVHGLYHMTSNNSNSIIVENIHTYTSGKTFILGGEPGKTGTIIITKISQREVSFSLQVKLDECPPFFRYDKDKKKCKCANNKEADYQNIIICNSHTEFMTSLLHGYWAGYDDDKGKTENFRYGLCPKNYCFPDKEVERHHELPPKSKELEMKVCGKTRYGVLCGRCRDDFCAHYHSNNFKCDTCSTCSYGWALYIVSELIPLAILFLLVVIFDISFTSGLLNGFIFYAQVFDSIFSIGKSFIWYPRTTYTLMRIIQVVYKFFNFDFFGDDILGFCLWEGATTLELLAFRFLTVAIAGLLVVSTVLFMKRYAYSQCLCLKAPPSMIHGLSAFLVMVYTQCTKIAFQLLDYSRVLDLDGNARRVLQYQGDMVYFSRKHIPFALLAIFCLSTLTLLPPLLLISYPLCYRVAALLKLQNNKFIKLLGKLIPLSKMKPIFDSFQGCFKDKYRHFAGLYFLYRVILLASVLTSDPILTNTMTQVMLVLMLTIHCLCWPYIRRLHNIIDGLILANLALINAFAIFNYHYAQVGSTYQKTINISTSIQTIFVYVPLCYFLGITIHALVKMCRVQKEVNSEDNEITLERLDYSDEEELTSSYNDTLPI
jgi:hypothetical protein